MRDDVKLLIKKYGIATAIATMMTLFVIYIRDYSNDMNLLDKYWILADAFTVPGVIFIMVGCLVAISTTGFFDSIAYAMKGLARAVLPFYDKSDEKYYDYKTKREEKRFKGYGFIFVVGGIFTAISLVFTALYMSL